MNSDAPAPPVNVIKNFDLTQILCLAPASMKLWQATLLACKQSNISYSSKFFTIPTSHCIQNTILDGVKNLGEAKL